jgi:signal transduction histidine kinase
MSTILVIDDRPTNREFLVTLLGYAGHRVLEAGDGAEGLACARAQRPDLVIADIIMPTMDGYAFVRQLREEPAIAATPVIFYTASYLEEAAQKLAVACGVTRILVKPSDPAEILAAVAEALGSAAAPPPMVDETFDREHLHLVTNKLAAKVDELEAFNDALEEMVRTRTGELAKANEELRDLNRMKDEFLAVVSHDLRSPLSGIQMISTIMRGRNRMTPADFDRNLETIAEAADHLLSLVNDLLDIAKIESGHASLEISELRVGDVISTSAKALSFNAHAKGVSLMIHGTLEEPAIEGDRLKLSQVFSNLIGNAIKFTPKGGEIRINIVHHDEETTVEIADTGQGIAPDALPHLFEKFGQRHSIGTAGERGTGLGLSIVRQLVELHGGTIEVVSEVGCGSTFTVHLPNRQKSAGEPEVTGRMCQPADRVMCPN